MVALLYSSVRRCIWNLIDRIGRRAHTFMYEFAVTPAVTQLRRRGVEIFEVSPGTIAAELELERGDRIMRVNGRPVRDYLDFRFHTAGETALTIDVRKSS